MSKVLIKYGFIFDPKKTWQTQEGFEQDLGKFFMDKGLYPEVIDALPGQEPITVVYLSGIENQPVATKDDVSFKLKGQRGQSVRNPRSK